jgi:CIC family chloride channel protein
MLLVSLELVRRFSPESAGSGVHEIEGALAGVRPLRWWRVIPTKFAAGVLSLGSGLALGREGPTIQMGGNLGQLLAVRLCLSAADAHALVAGGAAAGLAAAFNAPLSGIIFVIEEMRRHFRYGFRSFQSVLVCTALSDATVRALTGQQPVIEVLGVVGVGFNRALLVSLDFFSGLRGLAFSLRGLWVGAAVGLLAFFSAVSVGGGYTVVGDALAMRFSVGMLFALFALRFLTTVVSYGSGAPGGIFAPMLALGTLLGMGIGQVIGDALPILPHPGSHHGHRPRHRDDGQLRSDPAPDPDLCERGGCRRGPRRTAHLQRAAEADPRRSRELRNGSLQRSMSWSDLL